MKGLLKLLSSKKLIIGLLGIIGLCFTHLSFAATIVIAPNTMVDHPVTYTNATIDMSRGSFYIKNHATLTIKNCTIKGTLSPRNPILFDVDTGAVLLENNTVLIHADSITPHPMTQSLQYVERVSLGTTTLKNNIFRIDRAYTAGLLITMSPFPTKDFEILGNKIENFHGVIYLINSNSALIANNTLLNNSYGNIVLVSSASKVLDNTIMFSGNDRLGNSIDLINSDKITVANNQLLTPTCHGIYILNSQDIVVDGNKITGGITYAINILTYPEGLDADYVKPLVGIRKITLGSSNISITHNYMAQNRYGLAASDVDLLIVRDNYFIQRFASDEERQFWTNNDVLFKNVTNVTWVNNLYKEAFTQENDGDNSKTKSFVPFPRSGGVHL